MQEGVVLPVLWVVLLVGARSAVGKLVGPVGEVGCAGG